MKTEVLNALLTAKTLLDSARRQCFVRDRYVASAGLVTLQDAVELVLYACLLERGIDLSKPIEKLPFKELIGELRRAGIPVAKSGTLGAMNDQRIIVKHHAQLAEPAAVRSYYHAAVLAIDDLLIRVVGKPLQHLLASDAINVSQVKEFVATAAEYIEQKNFLAAMVEVRKALFVSIERRYDTAPWQHHKPGEFCWGDLAGCHPPYYTRSAAWISENVNEPIDFIQLDFAEIQTSMMALGVDPEEFFNVWRLTPRVYRLKGKNWAIRIEQRHINAATEGNARYCLDVVVSIALAQQQRLENVRSGGSAQWTVRLVADQPVLRKATLECSDSDVTLSCGDIVRSNGCATDFSGSELFLQVFGFNDESHFSGYIPFASCEFVDDSTEKGRILQAYLRQFGFFRSKQVESAE